MECFEIDFENRRARRYEIQPASLDDGRPGSWWTDEKRMAFEHQLVAKNDGAMALKADAMGVQALEAQREAQYGKLIRPSAKHLEEVVKVLIARRAPLSTAVLAIARLVGSLFAGPEEKLDEWLWLERKLRGMFERKGARPWHQSRVEVRLVPDKNGKPRLTLKPDNLAEALMLHAARMIATGTTFQVCEHCRGGFLTGGMGRGKSKKRADARFCSDRCRWTFNNERRRKE